MKPANNSTSEKKPTGLKNSRYWENLISKDTKKISKKISKKIPDYLNDEVQKSLH